MNAIVERDYHRPTRLADALEMLGRPDTAAIAGGTVINAGAAPAAIVLVDLQDLGLGGISVADDQLVLGAMVTLAEMATHPALPPWLATLARAEMPSTLRTLATIGGTVATAGAESALVAGLLVAHAQVEVARVGGEEIIALDDLLASRAELAGGLITTIRLETDGDVAVHRTARTPADTPIVACIARRTANGIRVAMSGVASTPMLVEDPATLDPPGDFRGSADYRRHLAAVLSSRARAELGADR